jgi:HAD superfamily phosphoserine phosphatase-like hydrolase
LPEKQLIIVTDLDGTLTTHQSSWQFVLEHLNLWNDYGKKNLELFLNNEIDYDEFIRLDVESMKGTSYDTFLSIIYQIPFRSGLIELFNYLKAFNTKNIILSSGLKDLAIRLSKIIPVDEIYANELFVSNNKLNGHYSKKVGWDEKGKIMKQIKNTYKNGIIIGFGDSTGDLPIFKLSDISFACLNHENNLISADYIIFELQEAIPIINEFISEL